MRGWCWIFLLFSMSVRCAADQTVMARQAAVESNLQFQNEVRGEARQRMLLAERMKALHVPGVSVVVIRRGKVDWAKGYGVMRNGGPPVSTKTIFSAASMSKPLTAVAVLELVEGGKLRLDDPVNNYLKRWKIPDNKFTEGHPVTIRQLLNHTSGIGTHNGQITDPDQGIPDLLQVLEGQKPANTAPVRVEAEPGSKYAYANGGYEVLQLLIEDVTGKPFAQYMQETVLRPLHMNDSTFAMQLSPAEAAHTATGYWDDGVRGVDPLRFVNTQSAAGGLWTTATDYAKFVIELQREDAGTSHVLLHQATVREMLTAGPGPSPMMRWGLGVRVGGTEPNPYFEHGGSGIFQTEAIGYRNGDGIVILSSGGGGGSLGSEVARSAAWVYQWPDFHADLHSVIALQPAELDKFIGTYDFIRITRENDHLMAEIPLGSGAKQRIFPETPTQFFLQDISTTLKFDRNDRNECTGVEFITTIVHWYRPKSG